MYGCEHPEELNGQPIYDWQPGQPLRDPQTALPRIAVDWNAQDTWLDRFAQLLEDPDASQLTGLIVGMWGNESDDGSGPIVEAVVTARDKLPNLQTLFFGDIISEENEISWIVQSDVSPLLEAYSGLKYFGVRGGNNLLLGSPRHGALQTLVVETGGLDGAVVRGLHNAQLPALEHLELWLGTDEYGASVHIEDVQPILSGTLFPSLKYLGLRNSDISDEIAKALTEAPILERIEILDLSMGTLSDEGAQALLENAAITKLKKLDLQHHYCSDAMMEKLQTLGIEVDLSEQEEEDEYGGESHRYVAVGE